MWLHMADGVLVVWNPGKLLWYRYQNDILGIIYDERNYGHQKLLCTQYSKR